jgi:ankyrin repeat protein
VFKVVNYAEQKNINPKRAEGTCRWALQSSEYIRWWESNCNDLLWVSADPGCGKSVLARSIIDDCLDSSHPSVKICYFFFKDNDKQNDLTTALCSVLHQLFSQQPHLLQHAIPAWEKNGGTLRQEVDELWRILIAATAADISCKTICVFDALHECRETDQRRLIEKLQAFHRQPSSSTDETCLKFLVTSRPYDHIQDHFRAITDSFPHVHIKGEEQNDQIRKEIELVLRIRVRELAKTVPLSPELHHRVEQQLLQMEHRTYLWLHLAIDDIRTTFKDSLRPAEDSITLIPLSVNAAYEKILSRVQADEMDTVKMILEIIVVARRPLTVREMAVALGIATYSEARTILGARLDPTHLERKIRQLCGLFVFTNNSKLYLIHQSARDFLIQKKDSSNPKCAYWNSLTDAEDQMAKICLRYLLIEDSEYDEGELGSFSGSFLEYSAAYWPDHVRNMPLTSMRKETDRVHRLYDMSGKPFSRWFPIFWRTIRPYERAPVMSALHLAAFIGHEQEVYSILGVNENDVNAPDDTATYPVMWASINGHDRVVQLLLERGADVNAQGGEYGNALQAACDRGHVKIAQMLLERGADVNAQGGEYGNALQAACDRGHVKIAQMLLERGADVNAQGGEYGNALQAACDTGHNKIAQMLLERGADVNAQGERYGNALQAVCDRGHDKIAQMLLERGANVNAQGGRYGNALQAACNRGHVKIAQMLLERGADVNAQGGRYGNALQAACNTGHDKIAQMLLERGADVNAQGGRYGNALQAACNTGHDKIAQMLLERGADVNAQGGRYGNALQVACFGGYVKIAQMLLQHGADVNLTAGSVSALSLTTQCRNGDLLELLLASGANVEKALQTLDSIDDRFYLKQNALDYAAAAGNQDMVKILISAGADVNHASKSDLRVPLHMAAESGQIDVVTALLDANADPTKEDSLSRTVLYYASLAGSTSIAQILESAIGHYNKGFKLGLCYRANTGGLSVHKVQITKRISDYILLSDILHAYKQRRCQGLRRYSLKGLQGVKPVKVK